MKLLTFLLLFQILSKTFFNDYPVQYHVENKKILKNIILCDVLSVKNDHNTRVKNLIQKLRFQSRMTGKRSLSVKLIDESEENLQILKSFYKNEQTYKEDDAEIEINVNDDPFYFEVLRKSNQEVLFSSKDTHITFLKNYRSIGTPIPTEFIFGFGERNNIDFNLKEGIYTLMNRDHEGVLENGTWGNNIYGSHPVYLMREKSGFFHVVFMQNSHPMDVEIAHESLTYRIMGGPIHLNFFLGDEYPETAIKQYHRHISGWALPPFWSLGYHHSRWGIQSHLDLAEIILGYRTFKIPLDVVWLDIDHMSFFQTFIYDTIRFPRVKMTSLFERYKVKYVPIVDPGIGIKFQLSPPYSKGIFYDVFIRSPYHGQYLLGKVWPGPVFFPDFLHQNANRYWHEMLDDFYWKIPFDGIWLDMNELANFCDGECPHDEYTNMRAFYKSHLTYQGYRYYKVDEPHYPFVAGQGKIFKSTIPLHTKHFGGLSELAVHNLYCLFQCQSTFEFLKSKKKNPLPFILTRATFPGVGAFAFHWTGDNLSTWEFLRISVVSLMSFNLFSIPMVGADICGFTLDASEELCARWVQVGALYPFARNHNKLGNRPQEFFSLGPMVYHTARKSLLFRYSFLKYYYTLFLKQKGEGTIIRPMFYEFPKDETNYKSNVMNEQFMIGESVMVAPVMYQGVTKISAYFPQAIWNNISDGSKIRNETSSGSFIHIESFLNQTAPIFLRGGHAVFFNDNEHVQRTTHLRGPLRIVASLQKSISRDEQNIAKHSFLSKGSLLGIANMSETNVFSKCRLRKCVHDFTVEISKSGGRCVLEFVLGAEEKEIESGVYIYKIVAFNFPSHICSLPKENLKCQFETFQLKKSERLCSLLEWKSENSISLNTFLVDLSKIKRVRVVF